MLCWKKRAEPKVFGKVSRWGEMHDPSEPSSKRGPVWALARKWFEGLLMLRENQTRIFSLFGPLAAAMAWVLNRRTPSCAAPSEWEREEKVNPEQALVISKQVSGEKLAACISRTELGLGVIAKQSDRVLKFVFTALSQTTKRCRWALGLLPSGHCQSRLCA